MEETEVHESPEHKDYGFTTISVKKETKKDFQDIISKGMGTDDDAIKYLIELFRFLKNDSRIKMTPKETFTMAGWDYFYARGSIILREFDAFWNGKRNKTGQTG